MCQLRFEVPTCRQLEKKLISVVVYVWINMCKYVWINETIWESTFPQCGPHGLISRRPLIPAPQGEIRVIWRASPSPSGNNLIQEINNSFQYYFLHSVVNL